MPKEIGKFGDLARKYNFSLNPYPKSRFTTCPTCRNKTGQRKLPLIIHIHPHYMIVLNYTNRYCQLCDMLIAHKHEIEHLLTRYFQNVPEIIGNDYLFIGTMEKKAWREGMKEEKSVDHMRAHMHDFKDYQEICMTMEGWFPEDQEPPVAIPPKSQEWVKQ